MLRVVIYPICVTEIRNAETNTTCIFFREVYVKSVWSSCYRFSTYVKNFYLFYTQCETHAHMSTYVPSLCSFHLPLQPSVFWHRERERLDGLEWCKGKLTEEWMSGKWKRESWYMLLYISVQTQTEKDMKTYIDINLRAEWKTDMWQLKEAKEKERVCDKRRKRGRWKRKNVPLTFRWWFMGGSGFRQNSSKIIKWLQLKS